MKNKYIDDNIKCYFSSNENGCSKDEYSSLNLAFQVGDDYQDVLKNRETYFTKLDVYNKSIFCYQTHSDHYKKVTKSDINKGLLQFDDGVNADAIYTFDKDICLNAYYADCTPIYFYSKKDNLIGIIHAGWQGSVNSITHKTISHIINDYKINPLDLKIIIGPSISVDSFLVDEDVVKQVQLLDDYNDCIFKTNDKYMVDVKRINYLQVYNLGVRDIMISPIDTFKTKEMFSYRRNKITGRMIASIINRSGDE